MDETNRNSMKLDIEAAERSLASEQIPKESYKRLPDGDVGTAGDIKNGVSDKVKNSNMVREHGDTNDDGADEKMLNAAGDDKAKIADKREEVKFISAGDHQNGDAKIDIGRVEKTFSGMTKEELMRYANDPFWVRLRWFLFVLFWALWVAMLVGAILIIINAPKCAAPEPLGWWKEGPLVVVDPNESPDTAMLETIGAKGLIIQLNGDDTYKVGTPEVDDRIVNYVKKLQDLKINVIVDVIPNYITGDSELFQTAKNDSSKRSPFIWKQAAGQINNWIKINSNGSAWTEVETNNYVLSQYGDNRYDLQMNDPVALNAFKNVIDRLVELGVLGFRVVNARHLIIDTSLEKEMPQPIPNDYPPTAYEFWMHTHTTFQPGLGELFNDLRMHVRNVTKGLGFLTIAEEMEIPEQYRINDEFVIDLPVYGKFSFAYSEAVAGKPNVLQNELSNAIKNIPSGNWLQWEFKNKNLEAISEYAIFSMLLPGVTIMPYKIAAQITAKPDLYKQLEDIRKSPSFMHGSFALVPDNNNSVIAYTRIKSGNPGFFVALNPSDANVEGNFSAIAGIPDELTVRLLSEKYNVTDVAVKTKVQKQRIPIAAKSVIVLTYVPITE